MEFFLGKPSKLYNVNDPDWAPTLKLGHTKVKSPSNDDVDRCRRVSDRSAKRVRLQEEIASKSQIVSVVSVDETIVEKEPACNFNSSGTEFEGSEQIHEFPAALAFKLSGLPLTKNDSNLPARAYHGSSQNFLKGGGGGGVSH